LEYNFIKKFVESGNLLEHNFIKKFVESEDLETINLKMERPIKNKIVHLVGFGRKNINLVLFAQKGMGSSTALRTV
jgi:hypothetical protein